MRIQNETTTIVRVSARGMVSSLGHNVETCCAAARAGIVRASEIDYFPVLSAVDEPENAIGHEVPLLTQGFGGVPRLVRLIQGALEDLLAQLSDSDALLRETEFYLSLPNPMRLSTGYGVDEDEETRKIRAAETWQAEKAPPDWDAAVRLLETAARLSAWPSKPHLRFVASSVHTGVAEAVHKALLDLAEGQVKAAVVGGADSLLDEATLNWLENRGRLKAPDAPAGLQPGEAAAFLLLEGEISAKERGARSFGVIRLVTLSSDTWTLLSEDPPLGYGLEAAIAGSLTVLESANNWTTWLITDQNGEPSRAAEWGNALVRLKARFDGFVEPILWYPASSFGDTGAASGAVAICMAMRAFERGYALDQSVVITSSSDGPMRAAMLLSHPDGQF